MSKAYGGGNERGVKVPIFEAYIIQCKDKAIGEIVRSGMMPTYRIAWAEKERVIREMLRILDQGNGIAFESIEKTLRERIKITRVQSFYEQKET